MDKKINIGCNAIVLKEGKVLLGKRKNCFGEGTWGLPGGHLEFGENLVDAAKRELREEIGIEATNLEFLSLVDNPRTDDHYIQANFLLQEYNGEVSLMEPEHCEGWEYFSFEELPEVFPPHQKIIASYLDRAIYLH